MLHKAMIYAHLHGETKLEMSATAAELRESSRAAETHWIWLNALVRAMWKVTRTILSPGKMCAHNKTP